MEINLLSILTKLAESRDNAITTNTPAVYMFDNEETKQYYIGGTIRKTTRFNEHMNSLNNGSHPNKLLQEAFNKNPNFIWKEVSIADKKEVFKIERVLIKNVKGDPNCLNIRGGTEPAMLNRTTSPETRALQSKIAKERFANGYITPSKGMKFSDASKKQLSDSRKKLFQESYINPFTGKTHSDENKKKQSDLANSQWKDPIFREQRSKEGIERFKDENFKLKHRLSLINAHQNKK